MVLGMRSKSRKSVAVQVEYLIHVQHIKPWPSSAKPDQCILIEWENEDQSSGSFKCGIGYDKIEIAESFKLPVTLFQELSKKKKNKSYQKNLLEFNLYEYQLDKAVKGQLLGSSVVNLGEYGVTREVMSISTLVNCKKGLKNATPPLLYVSIQPSDSDSKGGSGSVSAVDDEDEEIASFTDEEDDLSTHSSHTSSSLQAQKDEQEVETSRKGRSSEPHLDETLLYTAALLDPNEYKVVGAQKQKTTASTSIAGLQDEDELPGKFNRILQQETVENARMYAKSSSTALSSNVHTRSSGPHNYEKPLLQNKMLPDKVEVDGLDIGPSNETDESKPRESGKSLAPGISRRGTRKQVNFQKTGFLEQDGASVKKNELKRAKSSFVSSGVEDNRELLLNIKAVSDARKNRAQKDDQSNGSAVGNTKKISSSSNGDGKVDSNKVAMLEEELREAAALEVSLYSVVAEHGSSSNKIHSPARRLYRFYFHACNNANGPAKKGNAARAIFSGLALVTKACGNDVPRLTFWLSNVIILRAIVSHATEKGGGARTSSNTRNGSKSARHDVEKDDDWQDPQTFIVALEKVEAWIFSRIVESIWWQTMTPHMQTSAAKSASYRKTNGKKHMSGDQEQGSLSVELWKKAFKDACERLCPVRAAGHECACLPVLARLAMEQLVCRLDVAMFNAILRESADEMPTDPVSDPITDSKVLPIPAGKSGFAAGAQLKNAIGSWSRWLSDLFGIDEDPHEELNEGGDTEKTRHDSPSKAFHLLNALSNLMMLPFEMLADRSTRKEVCPTFGVPTIKRVLYNFVPDEFCPGPVPNYVFEALDTEENVDAETEAVTNIPYIAPATLYKTPSAALFSSMIGDIGSQSGRSKSTVLKKSYTSDDEVDQLDTPLASIILDKNRVSPSSTPPNWMSNGRGGRRVVRYELLREVWRDGE